MKYLLVNIETYAGDHHQDNNHLAIAEDHQKDSEVGDAVAKFQFCGYWDDSCSGFNTDCYLWHRVAYGGIKEISKGKFNQLKGYLQVHRFSDDELEKVQREMAGEEVEYDD